MDLRVIPRARKTELAGIRDEALIVRVAAPPVEGAANDAVVEYLAAVLHLARRAIHIAAGERGRRKRIVIDGVTADEIRRRCRL